MTQPSFDDGSFDAHVAKIRGLLDPMRQNVATETDPAVLHACVAELCAIAKTLPSSEKAYATAVMEALLADMDTLIAHTRNLQASLAKKLNHVHPHRQAVAAFLKASKTD